MENKVIIKNVDIYRLIGLGPSGHSVVMDSNYGNGTNSAVWPMELVIHSLGGCTGIDVLSIMDKMQVEYSNFQIDITYSKAIEHPRVYTDINLKYRMHASKKYMDKIEKAVNLSQNKYCPVTTMLKNAGVNVTYEIELF